MPRETADLAYSNPSIIHWAIEESQLSRDAIAKRLKVSPAQLRAWESGDAHPPFVKAQDLARVLHVPFGAFFLREPPSDHLPLPDFRGQHAPKRPSPELRQAVDEALVRRDWFRDYLRSAGRATALPFVGSFSTDDAVASVATDIRTRLGLTATLRAGVSSWSDYLSTLVRQAEEVGVLVFRSSIVGNTTQLKLSLSEVQGFAVADRLAPVVFINSADYKAAQIFTLAHELAHIWVGQSAIGDPNPSRVSKNQVEQFCNQVAAAVLVPRQEFLTAWEHAKPETRVQGLARRFWVSTAVVLRRALELGQLTNSQHAKLQAEELERVEPKKPSSGGDFYRSIPVRMSPTLTTTVLAEVNRDRLSVREAARLLSLRVATLIKYAEASR